MALQFAVVIAAVVVAVSEARDTSATYPVTYPSYPSYPPYPSYTTKPPTYTTPYNPPYTTYNPPPYTTPYNPPPYTTTYKPQPYTTTYNPPYTTYNPPPYTTYNPPPYTTYNPPVTTYNPAKTDDSYASDSYDYRDSKFPYGDAGYPQVNLVNFLQPNFLEPNFSDNLGELDSLYFRLWRALISIKHMEEQYGALVARMSLQKKFLDEFNKLLVRYITQRDEEQDETSSGLEAQLYNLRREVDDELGPNVKRLTDLNRNNTAGQLAVEHGIVEAVYRDILQGGQIQRLYQAVIRFKDTFFQIQANNFQVFDQAVARVTGRLQYSNNQADRRLCETGQVYLLSNELQNTYNFETMFDEVPGIVWGTCGFNIDLDHRHNPHPIPNIAGFNVDAYATKTGIVFQGVQDSFGDSLAVGVDVCFQACSILPGRYDKVYSDKAERDKAHGKGDKY